MAKMLFDEKFVHDLAMKALEYEFEGKTIREWIDILKYYQSSKWISVDDRLPDIDTEVLICTDKGLYYDVAQYSGGKKFWTLERNPDCWVTVSGVTHWMPLPEPPKEE